MYYNDYDVTAVLGGEVYDGSGDIDSATATKMTWFIQGDDSVCCLLFNFWFKIIKMSFKLQC